MTTNDTGPMGEELRQLIETIEGLEVEKADIAESIRDKFAEAKGRGYDTKVMREVIKRRKMDRDELDEQESILALYENAMEGST